MRPRPHPDSAASVRVVFASRIFAPERAAAAFRLSALVGALRDGGAEVAVLTTHPPEADANAGVPEPPGVRRWPVRRDATGMVRGYLPYLSFDLPLVLRLAAVRRPDVVVVEPPPTTGAVVRTVLAVRSRFSGRPVTPYVYYAADVWSDASASTNAPPFVVQLLRVCEQYALAGAAEVIAVSEGVADRVSALGARSVTVVPNGIDTNAFTARHPGAGEGPQAATLGIPSGSFLLYAGTASQWQGAEIFARVMHQVSEQVPSARLVFLGQGASWPVLQQIAARLPPGTIELRPLAPPEEAAAWHRAAAAAVVSVKPGLDYDFAYPTKVLAALACGTPVIYAGPGPAADDLRAHELGTTVAYDDHAVAAAMVQALCAARDDAAAKRRVGWVHANRSITAAAARASQVVVRAAGRG